MRLAPSVIAVAVLALPACHHAAPSTLDGHLAMPDGRHVLVAGTTNLPEQAQLLVTLQAAADRGIIVQALPLVKDGRFQALLALPGGLAGGDYSVRLTFSPAAFDWSRGKVLHAVGQHGEHLTGPWAKPDGDVTILQRELPLTIPQSKGDPS